MKVNVKGYKILTPWGYEPFTGIRKVHKDSWYRVTFTDGSQIGTSNNHRLETSDYRLLEVQNLEQGVKLSTGKVVQQVEFVDEPVDLYDICGVAEGHLYLTNGVVSKNCDCDFLTSGDTFFEQEDMSFYEETYVKDPVERRGIGGEYWIWEYPDYSRSYLISSDVARGDGADFSTAIVWDIETCSQIAEYQGQMGPKDFGAFLCTIATEYNNALLSVENASIGWATVEEILSRDYRNLYYSSTTTQNSVESYMHKSETGKLVPGFTNSPRTRPLMLSAFFDYIHSRSTIIRSKRLMMEMRTFVWNNSKAAASSGCHDDLVLAAAQGFYIRDTALKLRQQGLDLMRASLGAFGTLNKRDKPVVQSNLSSQMQNPYKVTDPYGNQEDISWILK